MEGGVLAVLLVAIVVAGIAIWMAVRAPGRSAGATVAPADPVRATDEAAPGATAETTAGAANAPAARVPDEPAARAPERATAPTTAKAASTPAAQAELPLAAAAPTPRAAPADDDLAIIRECVDETRRRAAALGVPSIFQDAYRFIRPWATSFAPGKPSPAMISDPEIVRGDPTTYRFRLKDRPYSIVRTDLGDGQEEPGGLVHERLRLLDASGTALFEMELFAADYGADERPGEITAFVEGPWIEDLRELNVLFSRDIPRISDDFRKKFRAKEAERLKRDIGV